MLRKRVTPARTGTVPGGATGTLASRSRLLSGSLGLLPIITLVITWQVWAMLGGQEQSMFLPTPAEVVARLRELTVSGVIFVDAASSVRRVLTGVALAAAVGVPVGMLMGISPLWRRVLSPSLEIVRPIPIAAWVPLVIIVFGIGEAPALALIFLGALHPILLNTVTGIAQTPPIHLRAAAMLGASRMTTVRRVLLPAALPNILTGLRLSLGIGWWVVILAELLAVRSGLGYRLVLAQQLIQTDTIVVVMVFIGAIGWVMNEFAVRLERRLVKWVP